MEAFWRYVVARHLLCVCIRRGRSADDVGIAYSQVEDLEKIAPQLLLDL